MALQHDSLLKKILSQPSAPFRERHVIETVKTILKEAKVPHFSDPIGNIVVGVRSKEDYLKLLKRPSKEPLRVFIAHMDHPGFHGLKWKSPELLEVKWHGGSPTQHLEGAQVWLANKDGWVGSGKMTEPKLIESQKAIDSALVRVPPDFSKKKLSAADLYGGFEFRAPMWEENGIIYTKAADDLVGTFAITSMAIDLWSRKKAAQAPFLGLLTRAEEVGFIGAIGHFELGWMQKAKRPLICVSLETSRTLPGAEIGKGPVIRLGDKTTVFDSGALRLFSDLASESLPGQHQRRVMDGGTCEATAATAFGFPCIGISVPLGNYHNQSFEGGPDSVGPMGPGPEFVHKSDVEGMVHLCHALLKPKLPWTSPWSKRIRDMKKDFKDSKALLRSGP